MLFPVTISGGIFFEVGPASIEYSACQVLAGVWCYIIVVACICCSTMCHPPSVSTSSATLSPITTAAITARIAVVEGLLAHLPITFFELVR